MQLATFKQWLQQVDQVMVATCGLGHQDVEDQDWIGLYNTGNTPDEAAKFCFEQMAENGYPDISDLVDEQARIAERQAYGRP